jgi:soluble lytic murein transglycosylase-like protein
MKKFPLLCALIIFSSLHVAAQAKFTYRFDNFDTREGVRVQVPVQPKTARQGKRLKLTARTVEPGAQSGVQTSAAPRATATSYAPSQSLSMTVAKSLDGFSTGDANVDKFIVESGTRNGVDPVLLYSIMHRESSFKRFALSPKGARGLMQLMPATAARFGVRNIFDPQQNIEGGARYVRFLLDLFDGDVRLALAGYNAGEGAVMKYGKRVPPYAETQNYVRIIGARYNQNSGLTPTAKTEQRPTKPTQR